MKRTVLIVFVLSFLLLLSSVALADDHLSDGPQVFLSGTGVNAPQAVINQLIERYSNAGAINITKWHPASEVPPPSLPLDFIGPPAYYYDPSCFTLNTTQSSAVLRDKSIISCAKGAQKTLLVEFSETVSSEVTLSSSFGADWLPIATAQELGIANEVHVTVSTTFVFSGPPEDSPYNSREFRVQ